VGAAIAINTLAGGVDGSGAYRSGVIAAGVLGIVMVVAGVRALVMAQKA